MGSIADEYIKLQKAEWGEFMRHVTPWEVDRYLTSILAIKEDEPCCRSGNYPGSGDRSNR